MASYKVSICIPTFNTKLEIFKRSLNSALNQDYKNLEIIVSENFSKNLNIFNYVKNNKRIKFFRHTKPLKAVDHLEFIMKKASGDYFMYLFDDDFISPNFVSSNINLLNNINKNKRDEYFITGKIIQLNQNIKIKYPKAQCNYHENTLYNYSSNTFLRVSKFLNFPHDSIFFCMIPIKALKKINYLKANSIKPYKDQMTPNLMLPFLFNLLLNLKLLYNKDAAYYFVEHSRRKPKGAKRILIDYFFGFFRIYKLYSHFLKILFYKKYYHYFLILFYFYIKNNIKYLKKTLKKIIFNNLY
jgi:glycosyltransferase involved in cell wall biosynthesis